MKDSHGDGGPAIIPSKMSNRLLRYIIATCHPKMNRRLKHKTLFQPYFSSLKSVEDFTFDKSLQEQPSSLETASDQSFLQKFVLPAVDKLRTSIPFIHQQAKLAEANQKFELYNENTCKEFHYLLLELLERFQTSVSALSALQKRRSPANLPSEQFEQTLVKVLLNGFALQRIAKGSALRMHMRTIEAKLADHRRPDMSPGETAEKDEEWGEEQDERDEELEAVQPYTVSVKKNVPVPVPLWKSYRNWLNLMLIYFDAVDVLVEYITGPNFIYKKISLKILVVPPRDPALLPWSELFTDSKLFPAENEIDPSPTTNDEILKFLEFATSPAMMDYSNSIDAIRTGLEQKNREATMQSLETLEKLFSNAQKYGWSNSASKLTAMIDDHFKKSSVKLSNKVTDRLELLQEIGSFFAFLRKPMAFLGALHCEASLASLLPSHLGEDVGIDSKVQVISAQMKVRYVVSR